MSKKGFTIVELAIVLVVIGIILGMAVKGKALVDAARMRAEVTKMNKFEAAVATYYARTNYLPEEDSGNILKEVFIDKELLTNRDFEVRVGTGFWTFNRCDGKGTVTAGYWYEASITGGSVCVYNTVAGNQVFAASNLVDAKLICNIEVMKDDENLSAGEGRGYGNYYANEASEAYRNCDNITLTSKDIYAFRAF